jgi:RHH-type proline utilization regulon transcriptional repressor/proline dehydrogenase/delta 1-pyrroline-5-carboxylate dehydrogenase
LVKGAYWDTETIEAKQKNWPIPVFANKAETDANYEDCTYLLLQNFPHIQVAFGSHNVRSIAYALETAKSFKIPEKAIEVQMLYGMAEPIKKTLTQMGVRVREYCPMGEMLPGMSYLVRRLLENTSNESWLRGKFAENKSVTDLLEDPKAKISVPLEKIRKDYHLSYQQKGIFYNEPPLDFAIASNRENMHAAIERQMSYGAVDIPLVINGELIWKDNKLNRINPSTHDQLVARVSLASTQDADLAVTKAKENWHAWKKRSFHDRASLLEKVADLMVKNRFDLMATQVLEVGKPWHEADGDVAEAIDFLRFYAREARKMDKPIRQAPQVPGEVSEYHYQSRGVTLVISPWNFPLAILTGQVAAALVTGNTVIMKPAEQASRVAYGLMKLLQEAGVPDGVIHFLPGIGEEVGAYLVQHPDISNIAFTGSKTVGLWIAKTAADTQPGQKNVKRCIIEMGGKNAIIVDNDADLDEAVGAVIYSAFGFSGQKCSACSRVIVLDEVHDKFLERLIEATRSIEVGKAMDPKPYTGPVVDPESQKRILETIERAKTQHKWELTLSTPQEGCFVGPTIFSHVNPKSELAQNEIFGPVLAVMKASSIDEAIEIANNTEYALTGGLFSRSPEVINQVKREFECGNLYINRGITGALVDRHPFGGFKMSGIGSKTGGPDYLLQFVEPRVVTENTMRRGFAPDV